MKVGLIRYHDLDNINTRLPESLNKVQGVLQPQGILSVAAVLKEAVGTKIIDAQILNLAKDEFEKVVNEERFDVVGITCMTSTVRGALEAAKICKDAGAITVLGGSHLSAYPKETLAYPYVDFAIVGDGEFAMRDLVIALRDKKSYKKIKGLVYRDGKTVVQNGCAIVEDLDKLPLPAYDLIPMKKYSSIISLHPVSTILSSRGCPFHCAFCFKQPTDLRLRMRSPKKVVDEIELLVKRYGIKELMFYDDTLTLRRDHIVGICNEILKRRIKVKWESLTRVNSVNQSLLKLMKKAGCHMLRYGIESGDERIIRLMKKGIKIEKVKQVLKMTHEVGMDIFAYFMIGYPTEDEETINKTINLAIELDPDYVMFTAVTPYPKTPLYDFAQKVGLVKGDYWKKFVLKETDERIPYFLDDAEEYVKEAYQKFYFRPSFILKKLKKARNWDFLKKNVIGALSILFFKMKD